MAIFLLRKLKLYPCAFDANRLPWAARLCTICEKSICGAVFTLSPLLFAKENGTIILPRWVIVVRITTKVVKSG